MANETTLDIIIKLGETELARLKAENALEELRDFMRGKMVVHLSEDFAANPDNPDPQRPWTLKFDIGDINYVLTGSRE